MTLQDWQHLFESSPALHGVADGNGRLLFLNSRWVAVLGYDEAMLKSRTYLECLHPADRDRASQAGDTTTQVRLLAHNGRSVWTDWLCVARGDRSFITAHPMAEDRSRLYQELSEKTARLDRLTENAPGMFYQFRREPTGHMYFTFVGSKAYEIYELHPEDFQKNPAIMLEMADPEGRDGLASAIEESARTMTKFEWRGRIRTKTGAEKWIHAESVPQPEADGGILWDGVALDITKSKRLQELLELERAKSVQTAKLATLGELAAGMAHEINNPLCIMLGHVELLPNHRLDEKRFNDKIAAILKSGARISNIVRGLKKFSRSSEHVEKAPRRVADILNEILILSGNHVRQNKVELTCDLEKDLWIKCNEVEIEQVLLNLINNSVDAILSATERWIRVQAWRKGNLMVMTVTDSGRGVPSDRRDLIFAPFFTTKPPGKGTGLGLTISKGILNQHGGDLRLVEDAKFTCFEITLPLHEPVDGETA